MDAIRLFRDVLYDESCSVDSNIHSDEDERKLWFVFSDIQSIKFDFDASTPLILQSTNAPCTLYQIYLFVKFYDEDNPAEYALEVRLNSEADFIGDSQDQTALNAYFKGRTDTFRDLASTALPPPQSLQTALLETQSTSHQLQHHRVDIDDGKKRKQPPAATDDADGRPPPHKKQRVDTNANSNGNATEHAVDDALLTNSNNAMTGNNSSLFTENYHVAVDALHFNDESITNVAAVPLADRGHGGRVSGEAMESVGAFWKSLPDPQPLQEVANEDAATNWREEYRSRIRESASRNDILHSRNKKPFNDVAGLFPAISTSLRKLIKAGVDSKITKQRFVVSESEKTLRDRNQNPIIVVPHSDNSLLSLTNCLSFLRDGKYVPSANSLQAAYHQNGGKSSPTKPDVHSNGNGNSGSKEEMCIYRESVINPRLGKKAKFEIRSSSSFNKDTAPQDWARIVAVFVIGKQWQFKKWITGWRKPEEIFNKSAGFYLHFKDDPANKDVKNWRVNCLPIRRNGRHDDARIANEFWDKLVTHLRSKHKNKKLFY